MQESYGQFKYGAMGKKYMEEIFSDPAVGVVVVDSLLAMLPEELDNGKRLAGGNFDGVKEVLEYLNQLCDR